jgi:hypothetical protein
MSGAINNSNNTIGMRSNFGKKYHPISFNGSQAIGDKEDLKGSFRFQDSRHQESTRIEDYSKRNKLS